MRSRLPRPRSPRRGVTLVEMLVTVALLLLMMTALVQIFSAATGAVTAARTYQELDGNLRQLDATIRTDLQGITAKMTPPNDPEQNLGYFEYGENQFADLQGEDTDDYMRFTAKAPEGQVFTGRLYTGLPPGVTWNNLSNQAKAVYLSTQPITITSQYAEIIYFLRNGNLYRRVFLIVPERQSSIIFNGPNILSGFVTPQFDFVSWIGMNDVSARPNSLSATSGGGPKLNTLGDLTNRHNRAFYPRFTNDYCYFNAPTTYTAGQPDQLPDMQLGIGIPDWAPTFYPQLFSGSSRSSAGLTPTYLVNQGPSYGNTPTPPQAYISAKNPDLMAFPYVYMGAYSKFDTSSSAYGQLHGMPYLPFLTQTVNFPLYPVQPYGYYYLNASAPVLNPNLSSYGTNLNRPNHAPLESGDNLATPTGNFETWWGFPTWRETMHPTWDDPASVSIWSTLLQSQALSYTHLRSGSTLLPP